jgi:outer membrane protein TolC
VVQEVLARNPSLAQMVAVWQAAVARYPQVTSLDDPMAAATLGPGTFAPDDPGTHFAYRLELSQKYPWPGKLALRGQSALAEARAADADVADMRLQLVQSARDAFAEYYLAVRALEINAEGLQLLAEFRRTAQNYFEHPTRTRTVPIADVYQADVEIGRQRERRLTLERMRRVAVARLNTLMHLPPDAPLPPPPAAVPLPDTLPDAGALRALALARRPDVRAVADRLRADEASLALACKDYRPDFEPFVMYDRFMGNNETNADLATMVGVRVNLPVRTARRGASVAEARARIAQRRAELTRLTDQVGFQVQEAFEQVRESAAAARLYREQVLRSADEAVRAASVAYQAGQVPALSYIGAERARVELYDRYQEILADYIRRQAALERAAGGAW